MQKLLAYLYPFEWALIAFTLLWVLSFSVLESVTYYYPLRDHSFADQYALGGIDTIYAIGLLTAAFVVGLFRYGRMLYQGDKINDRALLAHFALILRGIAAFVLTLFLAFNVKWWPHIMEYPFWDAFYNTLDSSLFLPIMWLADIARPLHEPLHDYYGLLYVLYFIAGFILFGCLFSATMMMRTVSASIIVILIGSLCYQIAPAYGPFIFDALLSNSEEIAGLQQVMYDQSIAMIGASPEQNAIPLFSAALGAMPSMHVGCMVTFAFYGFRHSKWIGWLYVLIALHMGLMAISTGFHYVIDLPIGVLVAMLGCFANERLYQWKTNS